MTNRPARIQRIRTTQDGAGRPHGVATGLGPGPQEALNDLQAKAQVLAEQVVNATRDKFKDPLRGWPLQPGGPRPVREPPEEWPVSFEVIDVRLTPARLDGGGTGWLAYGTLAQEGPPSR